jgi:hypothetical protein
MHRMLIHDTSRIKNDMQIPASSMAGFQHQAWPGSLSTSDSHYAPVVRDCVIASLATDRAPLFAGVHGSHDI